MSDQPVSSDGYLGDNPPRLSDLRPAGEHPPRVYIVLVKSRLPRKQRWRWVAVRAGNSRKLATSGEWYTNRADALEAIQILFGYGTDVYMHPSVSFPDVLIRGAR
ncbi:hypothetical protein B1R94_26110 [Mycolicibacterium litorale]|nr:hypothetical protein B1R94_26110 [Mycolicibacterium litorale]